MENFKKFNLNDDINKSLKGLRFTKPTEIPSKSWKINDNDLRSTRR